MTLQQRHLQVRGYLGKTVTIGIDRPMGFDHKKKDGTVLHYPINYGYIPEVLGGDDEELDVYLLGVDHPVESYTARIIGIVYRRDDVEDKLIASPDGMTFTAGEVAETIRFQEQYYNTFVQILE